ncbi:MAG: hypothetical protein Q8N15_06410 [Bacillota bacterium]|nr:hypothetical protein [Bacillota bacterium]
MKKPLLALFAALLAGALLACERTIPDYSVAEAFDLMNEAIDGWLDAKSFTLSYEGTYTVGENVSEETMSVKLKNGGSDNLIAFVVTSITEPDRWQQSETQFEDGRSYAARNENGSISRTWKAETGASFETLYRTFLKRTIDLSDIRNESILVDPDQCTFLFEYDANEIEETFYVSPQVTNVTFATVSVTFSHQGELLSIDVSYGTFEGELRGTESYQVTFAKLDRYVVISQMSATEKAYYTEATDDEE